MKAGNKKTGDARELEPSRPVERIVSLVLRAGVILSASIICIGLALLAAKGTIAPGMRLEAALSYPRSASALIAGLFALDPASVITLGLLVLIATPFARVAVSIAAFAVERDWRYVAVTALVLAILIAGIIVGKTIE